MSLNPPQVLAELKEYATEVDVDFVRKAVRAIGRCAIKVEVSRDCTSLWGTNPGRVPVPRPSLWGTNPGRVPVPRPLCGVLTRDGSLCPALSVGY